MVMSYAEIIQSLKTLSDPTTVERMAIYGIIPAQAYGVSLPELRRIAKYAGKDHELAVRLWKANFRETRILASMIEDPKLATERQIESWVKEFDYWEICDQCCMNLFEKMPVAYKKCTEWSSRKEEFIKRAGFVLMARLAVSDKKAGDRRFEQFFPLIEQESGDERNMVKKAVNWALRQIGKRNGELNRQALASARRIRQSPSKSARWVAADAIRELTSEGVQKRLKKNAKGKKQ